MNNQFSNQLIGKKGSRNSVFEVKLKMSLWKFNDIQPNGGNAGKPTLDFVQKKSSHNAAFLRVISKKW